MNDPNQRNTFDPKTPIKAVIMSANDLAPLLIVDVPADFINRLEIGQLPAAHAMYIDDVKVAGFGEQLLEVDPTSSRVDFHFERLLCNGANTGRYIIVLTSRDVIDEITAGEPEPFLEAFNKYVGNVQRD